jgi:hypothetical protein
LTGKALRASTMNWRPTRGQASRAILFALEG